MKKIKFIPFYTISILPFWLLYRISDIIFLFIYHVYRYRRKIVKSNIEHSFSNKNLKEVNEIARRFYKYFCDVYIESIKSLTISKKEIHKRFVIKNPEFLQKYYDNKKSIILYTAHYGNWEWLAFLPLFTNYQITTFYQPLSNKYFDELMKMIRQQYGAICIESSKGYKSLLKFENENILSLNCMIGDQCPRINSSLYWTTFLNQKTAFLTGGDRIAKKTNQIVVFPFYQKLKRGHYEVNFILIDELPKQNMNSEIIDKYAHLLEDNINNAPELWLWSHRRWKLTKTNGNVNF